MDPGKKWTSGNSPSYWAEWEGSQLRDREFLRIWDAKSGKLAQDLSVTDWVVGKPKVVTSIGWSPDGKWLAAGSLDGRVRIWDAHTRQRTKTISSNGEAIESIAWHKDSRLLAVGAYNPSTEVIDILEGKSVWQSTDGNNGQSVAWSPDGTEMVTMTEKFGLVYRDVATGKVKRQSLDRGRLNLTGHLTSDGQTVIAKHDLWAYQREFDAETGDLLGAPKTPGGWLVASALDARWRAYAYGKEVTVATLKGAPIRVDLPASGRDWSGNLAGTQLAGVFDQQVIVWDVENGKRLFTLDHPTTVRSKLSWSPDGKQIVTATSDKVLRLWDTSDGKLIRTFDKLPASPPNTPGTDVVSMTWNPDNRNMWRSNDVNIQQLDTKTGSLSAPENYSNGNVIDSIELAADGDSLLVRERYSWTLLKDREGKRRSVGQYLGKNPKWHPDARRFVGEEPFAFGTIAYDTRRNHRLGTLWPAISGDHWMCVGPDGHWRGSVGAESQIVYVAMLDDGSQRTYTFAEFEKLFGWKNDPSKARLLKLDP